MSDQPEFITPPNGLQGKVTVSSSGVDLGAIEKAEKLIAGMQSNYLEWVEDDLARIKAAYEEALLIPADQRDAVKTKILKSPMI
jgi:hypothetical protein